MLFLSFALPFPTLGGSKGSVTAPGHRHPLEPMKRFWNQQGWWVHDTANVQNARELCTSGDFGFCEFHLSFKEREKENQLWPLLPSNLIFVRKCLCEPWNISTRYKKTC